LSDEFLSNKFFFFFFENNLSMWGMFSNERRKHRKFLQKKNEKLKK